MKKLICVLLTLILSCTLLVACGGGGDAPAELTKETIVGKWECDMGALLGGGKLVSIMEFTEDGKYITSIDTDEYRKFLKDLYATMPEYANLDASVLDSAINMAMSAFESMATSTYSFDGTKLTLSEVDVEFTYVDGVFTITMEGQDMVLTYIGN